ncbi:L-rhamnose mutarotase [Pseudomonas retamae]|uniref:L-rhamnose mutarotase n=1 Tax=Pseudomonas retamae TaxID=702110 RepID=A0ABW7DDK1_9PSED
MLTRAFRMNVYPGQESEYLKRHDEIWPRLLKVLQRAGIADYKIFLDEVNCALFAVMTYEQQHLLDNLAVEPVMQEWWQYMREIMPSHADGSPIAVDLQPIFKLPQA